MLLSMTGYGRSEVSRKGITAVLEIRSVNNRFLEVSARLPRSLSAKENEVKEVIRRKIQRGKIYVTVTIDRKNDDGLPLKINVPAAKEVHKLLNQLRKTTGLRESVKIEHLLHFSEVIDQQEVDGTDELEWSVVEEAIGKAVDSLQTMRKQEGRELEKDFRERIGTLDGEIARIEELSKAQVPAERDRLRERVKQLMENNPVDDGRLEMELAIMADRLDVTEECVRFRSHTKFFLESFGDTDSAGRKLNFLLQEMNREVNTIGSKSSDAGIAHMVVHVKEELERVREQIQNIE
jgi:uncharacterized protein (TIGR00255 family)